MPSAQTPTMANITASVPASAPANTESTESTDANTGPPSSVSGPDTASYSASGFNNKMGWGHRPALLLIDICKAYWTPTSPLSLLSSSSSTASSCLDTTRRLLAAARTASIPIFWTAVEYTEPNMADAGLFWLKAKALDVWHVNDTRGLDEWVEGLEPREEDGERVVKKKYPSGFFGTTLQTELMLRGVDTVVICGVSTSGCVRATALDAMQYGFRPMVVGAACGDRSEEIQRANLFDLNAKYADVVSEKEAIEKMSQGWSCEQPKP